MVIRALVSESPCLSDILPAPKTGHHPMISQDDERELLSRVASQDEQAFTILHARYAKTVCGYVVRRLGQADLVDDVLQEVMLVLWQRAAKIPPTVPLGSWLCGVARYKIFKVLARASRPTASEMTDKSIDNDEPENVFLRQEHGVTLERMLDTLPHGERTAIKLLFQGYSYQEIAAETGDPVSTVRTRVLRARQRLQARVSTLDRGISSPS